MQPLHLMIKAAAALPMASLVVSGAIVEAPEGTNIANNCASEIHGAGGHECFESSPRPGATPDFTTTIESDLQSPYRIIIDGGSTGSRLHIFEFVYNTTTREVECVRRGNAKAWTPLSEFARSKSEMDRPLNSTEVAEHLLPLFEYAAELIPERYHSITPATYQATAGMRLLEESEQNAVYESLYTGLMESDRFPFDSMKQLDITTLDGATEGLYGAIAANYLRGFISADMTVKQKTNAAGYDASDEQDDWHLPHHGPLGALDLGGASAQMVYLPELQQSCPLIEPHTSSEGDAVSKTCSASGSDRLDGDAFFATSYLGYGVDQFRERLWDVWIEDYLRDLDPKACDVKILDNPCGFKGHVEEYKDYTLVGAGDAGECANQVRRLIPHHEDTMDAQRERSDDERVVGGVRHPPLRGKFYGMSNYFFALDFLRELSGHEELHLNWPTPSMNELAGALNGLCSRSWQGDLEEIQHNSHAFTRAQGVPYRCMESVYLVTLLRDGFGFHPESRDITFSFEVEGSEVEWSLGMALAEAGPLEWLRPEDGVSVDAPRGIKERDETETTSSNHTSETCVTSTLYSLIEYAGSAFGLL